LQTAFLVKISGRVTGVGFRYSALIFSQDLPSLTGYIRNVGYGGVETVIQGDDTEVRRMLAWLREGPSLARVDEIIISDLPTDQNYGKFHIR